MSTYSCLRALAELGPESGIDKRHCKGLDDIIEVDKTYGAVANSIRVSPRQLSGQAQSDPYPLAASQSAVSSKSVFSDATACLLPMWPGVTLPAIFSDSARLLRSLS